MPLDRIKTGIPGLDELLEGGIPKGRCVLVAGGPGSGKTTMSMQFIAEGAQKYGERGVFVTLADSPSTIREDMSRYGWALDVLEESGALSIVDLSMIVYLSPEEFAKALIKVERPKYSVETVVDAVKRQIKATGAKRVVIDSLSPLVVQERNPVERRREVAYLLKGLMETGCTCLLTAEAKTTDVQRGFSVEEYLSQGVIHLQSVAKGDRLVRVIQVTKMRGTAHDMQPHPYLINEKGIEVFPKEILL